MATASLSSPPSTPPQPNKHKHPHIQIFFDLIPLRVLPTLVYGAITYGMIGLRPGFQHFVLYEAFLVLLVTTSAVISLVIGMLTRHIMSGILIATIVMIHFLMLTNLFINFDSMNIKGLRFLKRVSFFNYAYEGMAENELVGRRLEHFAISTGTGVLHELGFSTTAMYFDLMSLLIYLMVAVAIAFVVLKVAVREMR
jgi:ABC-type transport system involved in multi-copper enzyme maturation permease subunit